ncbi:peptide/nickel transport system permease protein [Bosea sp. OK403]|jgi:peptide/nickel transport system permease protein|uniref:ABC transporter permease n=1 Tax=Bosea sp. OK403 TaxID=1855286 RepID=UPI0008E0B179|nr:ABC transporter permease [Bosea sp. OK403]SFJ70614.1 peptide/nickel transport system permease protein [Bosea sp. OK403]
MLIYILKRLAQLVPVLFGITLACFLLLRALPGDPATLLLGARGGPEEIALMKQRLGLDLPLWRQYLLFLGDIVSGSLGRSVVHARPVMQLVLERLPATLWLVAYSTALAVLMTVPLALWSAMERGRPVDLAIKLAFTIVIAMPSFWLGLIFVILFAIWLPLFPTSGYGDDLLSRLHHTTLPALVIALATASLTIRSLRSAILAVLGSDYVTTARAKGAGTARLMTVHVLPNALISSISVLGAHTSWVIGGTVVIETVFALPGLGSLFVESIFARDYPLIQGLTIVFAVLVVLINLATDLAYALADPRIRLE